MKASGVMVAVALLACVAGATTVIPMTVEELTHAASRVVEGEVMESWSAWNPERTSIYTYSRVHVSRTLKGGPEAVVTIRQSGGSVDGMTMKVSGVHTLQRGEQTLLFLRPASRDQATWSVVGLMLGHFRMYSRDGKTVVSNGWGVRTVSDKDRNSRVAPSMALQDMESRIRGALTR